MRSTLVFPRVPTTARTIDTPKKRRVLSTPGLNRRYSATSRNRMKGSFVAFGGLRGENRRRVLRTILVAQFFRMGSGPKRKDTRASDTHVGSIGVPQQSHPGKIVFQGFPAMRDLTGDVPDWVPTLGCLGNFGPRGSTHPGPMGQIGDYSDVR